MALQVSTGPQSLVGLGISVSDVATLYGLARRFGNWLTAATGDQEFLNLLDQDEMDILHRKGLIDLLRFNKQWGSKMTLLANGKPTSFVGKDAEKNLDTFSRFTAVMVCVIAALEAFASREVARLILKSVLLELLQTTEWGEDILASHFGNRVNCWQSAADVRGLSGRARQIRQSLLNRDLVLDGLMPIGDSKAMVQFLVWLLASNTTTYITPSSDIAGVGVCLSQLGIDILGIIGMGEETLATSCQLEYYPQAALPMSSPGADACIPSFTSRGTNTTVNLQSPEESFSKFPIDAHTSTRCRQAWCSGSKAAEAVGWTLVYQSQSGDIDDDIKYVFYDKGSENIRTRTKIGALVEAQAFIVNREVCQQLELTFQRESDATLDWLLDQTLDSMNTDDMVCGENFRDQKRINVFTIFQAFFMGYYYAIVFRLIDTSGLQLKIVDGDWGYRSVTFLVRMKSLYLSELQFEQEAMLVLRREDMISLLASMVCNNTQLITRIRKPRSKDSWCVGITGKRTLVVQSLLKPCFTLSDVGKFVLLDIDASGIPRDKDGLIRPGVADGDIQFRLDELELNVVTEALREDVSFHIEADWGGDPDTMLTCIRYKGRRTWTLNPAVADAAFCVGQQSESLVTKETPLQKADITKLVARECLNRQPIQPNNLASPYVLDIRNKPRLCYAILYWYRFEVIRLAGDSLDATTQYAKRLAEDKKGCSSYIVIANGSGCLPSEDAASTKAHQVVNKYRSQPGTTLLGDDRNRNLSL
ncbi:hypothetical protein MMC10_010079 [Thelotrema lepadinum]|nr:hypothetical protein [Thelotrema lepadinum]